MVYPSDVNKASTGKAKAKGSTHKTKAKASDHKAKTKAKTPTFKAKPRPRPIGLGLCYIQSSAQCLRIYFISQYPGILVI